MGTRLQRIRIPSTWRENDGMKRPKCGVADFKLGLGTCGKVVRELYEDWSVPGILAVTQVCTDNSTKVFRYPLSTITGRVESTYLDPTP